MLCETIGRVCCPSYLADFQLFFGTPTLGRTAQLHRCDASGSLRPNALLFAMRCWHLSKHAVRPFFKPKSSSPSCLMNMISRAPRLKARVSASPEEVAGRPGCVCGCAITTLPPTITTLQSLDLRVSRQPAQSESVKPSTVKMPEALLSGFNVTTLARAGL